MADIFIPFRVATLMAEWSSNLGSVARLTSLRHSSRTAAPPSWCTHKVIHPLQPSPEMKYLHICSQLYNGADQRKLLQGVRRPLRRRRTDATVSSDPAPAAVTRDLRFTFKTMDHLH
ncbi:hypothetical protein ACJJTC_018169 [Scirpophaga incertulas]